MLPIDLVLVRHGQSEANAALRLIESRADGYQLLSSQLQNMHSSRFHLTKSGQEQTACAADWIKENIISRSTPFHGFITSPYVRAQETAALLNIKGAEWIEDYRLAERDGGELESPTDSRGVFVPRDSLIKWQGEPFFCAPRHGESFAQLCIRLELFLNMLRRRWSGRRVIIVCHGDVIRGFRFLLENIPIENFKEMARSKHHDNTIYNCQIIHYTRVNPDNGDLSDEPNWVQVIRPTENPVWIKRWQGILPVRSYSNDELLHLADFGAQAMDNLK